MDRVRERQEGTPVQADRVIFQARVTYTPSPEKGAPEREVEGEGVAEGEGETQREKADERQLGMAPITFGSGPHPPHLWH